MDILTERVYEQLEFSRVREEIPDLSEFFMHVHTNMELLYFIEGNMEYHVENSAYIPRPGDILIMRAGEVHCAQVDHSCPYDRITLNFSPELLKETLNGRLLSPYLDRPMGTRNHYSTDELPADYIRMCFDRMFAHEENTSQMRPLVYLLGILQEIYDVWVTKRQQQPAEQPDSLATQLISYINQHLYALKSPQQLEQQFFLSQSQLNRVFQAFTGTSVWKYVQIKRLFAARELLQSGVRPQTAAAQCGYQEYSTFFRAYKKHFGHTPHEDLRRD